MLLRYKPTGLTISGYIQTRTYGKYEVVNENNLDASFEYDTLAALNEDWEDAEEPLIKDWVIRKAVRAWAEAIELNPKDKTICVSTDCAALEAPNGAVIYFVQKIVDPSKIENGEHYSIEELCGSEEIEILEPNYTTIEEKEKLKEKQ